MSSAEPAPGPTSGSTLSDEELRRLCDMLYRRTGMAYGEAKRYYIERRVADRMQRSNSPSVPAYMALLRASSGEMQQLINSFTVNETYFYREEHQFRCLERALLPEIVAGRGPGDLVRIWSLPCSTGEEPYSIAIWLLENWRLVDAYNVEIIGSDIDTRALAAALEAEYGQRALARLPEALRRRYFEPSGRDQWRLIQDLRESVRFAPVNLMDAASMAAQSRFDVIFCRNVLIYFDDLSRQEAVRHLHEALNPGGFLCLGHSESMSRITDRFETRRFEDGVVYQRRIDG